MIKQLTEDGYPGICINPSCNKSFWGRIDKQFCSNQCRSRYANHKRRINRQTDKLDELVRRSGERYNIFSTEFKNVGLDLTGVVDPHYYNTWKFSILDIGDYIIRKDIVDESLKFDVMKKDSLKLIKEQLKIELDYI